MSKVSGKQGISSFPKRIKISQPPSTTLDPAEPSTRAESPQRIDASPNSAMQMKLSAPMDNSRVSILDIPVELRMEIWTLLLDSNNIPRSYGYTAPLSLGKARPSMLKHGMLVVSKQLSAEYRQAFYERTTFFLRIDSNNAFRGVPNLSSAQQDSTSRTQAGIPNFWNAPDALLQSLRHCTIYIELGQLASQETSKHSVSRVVLANTSLTSARKVRKEMMAYSSLDELKAQDRTFDKLLQNAIKQLLDHMQQLRSVCVVWDTAVESKRRRSRFSMHASTNWTWEAFGTPLVETLRQKLNMRSFQIKVGDSDQDTTYKATRAERGRWDVDQQEYNLKYS